MKKVLKGIIICLISALALVLPVKGAGADSALLEQREQEFVSPEIIRELARVHYARARGYYRRGEYSKAKAEFEGVLKLEPKHQGAQWYLKCVERELDKYEKTFSGRLEKLKESKKAENLKSALDSIEERSPEGQLRVERARRRELEKEEAKLSKQIEEYQAKTEKAKKGKNITARKVGQLQKEKNDLETEVKKYKQSLKKQEPLIEQAQRESEQKASVRLKEAEAEKQKLAKELSKLRQKQKSQVKTEVKKYQQSLRKKFDQKIDDLNKRIDSYEAKVKEHDAGAKQHEAKVKKLEETNEQLKKVQAEKENLQAELAQLHKEQKEQLKDKQREYEKKLQDKLKRKEVELDERIKHYDTKLIQLEEKNLGLEEIRADTYRQTWELNQTEQERESLQAELVQLRKEQQTQLKDELQEYEQTIQDKLERKEAELDEKIKAYEVKIDQLQKAKSYKEEVSVAPTYIIETKEPAQSLKKELTQVERAEAKLFELQMKINEQLQAQLDEFKKGKARPLYEQGLTHLKNKKYSLARESFQKALSIYPNYTAVKKALEDVEVQEQVEMHLAEGQYYYQEKEYQKAKGEFNQTLSLDYKNRQARNFLHKIDKEIEQKRQAEILAQQKEKERLEKERVRLAEKQRQAKEQALIEVRKKRKEEQARKAREERLAKLKAEKEEQLLLRREAEAKLREEEARLKKEQEQKAREEKLARLKAEKEEQLARIKAEKEEEIRLKREAEEKGREQARLKKEQEQKRLEQARLKKEQEQKAREEKL
ncbi:MAG: tetratricopeptide repeat protein, partial [Candidatus Omnitrophica bacterium]|nr:tetratricopeptide repeat protein [Candidatus Omnitrophota bacterium]